MAGGQKAARGGGAVETAVHPVHPLPSVDGVGVVGGADYITLQQSLIVSGFVINEEEGSEIKLEVRLGFEKVGISNG